MYRYQAHMLILFQTTNFDRHNIYIYKKTITIHEKIELAEITHAHIEYTHHTPVSCEPNTSIATLSPSASRTTRFTYVRVVDLFRFVRRLNVVTVTRKSNGANSREAVEEHVHKTRACNESQGWRGAGEELKR